MFVDRQTTKPYPLVADAYCSLEVKEVPELLRLIGLITPGFDDQQKAGIVSLIKGSAVDDLVATMAFVKYQGESTQLDVEWQTGGDGRILMSFTTNACLAASMQRRIHAWCGAKRIPILGWCKAK